MVFPPTVASHLSPFVSSWGQSCVNYMSQTSFQIQSAENDPYIFLSAYRGSSWVLECQYSVTPPNRNRTSWESSTNLNDQRNIDLSNTQTFEAFEKLLDNGIFMHLCVFKIHLWADASAIEIRRPLFEFTHQQHPSVTLHQGRSRCHAKRIVLPTWCFFFWFLMFYCWLNHSRYSNVLNIRLL